MENEVEDTFEGAMGVYMQSGRDQSPMLEGFQAEEAQEAQFELDQTTQGVMSHLPPEAPDEQDYDYARGVSDGDQFPVEQGGVNTPNRYIRPDTQTVGGYDIADGQRKLKGLKDDNGFVKDGVEGLQKSYTNSLTGTPIEDSENLAKIAYGALDGGGEIEDLQQNLPKAFKPEDVGQAWEVASRARLQEMFENGELDEELENAEEAPSAKFSEPLREEDFLQSEGWMDDAKAISGYMMGEEFEGTPEELHEWMLWQMSHLNAPVYGGVNVARWAFAPPEVQDAVYRVLSTYEATENSWAQFGRGVGINVVDPTSWGSLGAGVVAAKAFGKTAIGKILAGSGAAMAVGAIEGAAYTTLDDFYRQAVPMMADKQEGYDVQQGAEAAAMGAVGGATIGGAMKYAGDLSARASQKIGDAWSGPPRVATVETRAEMSEAAKALEPYMPLINASPELTQRYSKIYDDSMTRIMQPREGQSLSIAEEVLSSVVGQETKMPSASIGIGTFEGVASKNMRLPMPANLPPEKVSQFLAIMGKELQQYGTPASRYTSAKLNQKAAEGTTRTYSILVPETLGPEQAQIIEKTLGYGVSISKKGKGSQIDILPFNSKGEEGTVPLSEVERVITEFGNPKGVKVQPVDFSGNYVDISETESIVKGMTDAIDSDAINQIKKVLPNESTKTIRELLGSGGEDLQQFSASKQRRLAKIRADRQRRTDSISSGQRSLKESFETQEAEIRELTEALKGGVGQ